MLKNILISKVRIKVLEQFFFNPKEQYHVRGLVRILNEEINAIRRELINLNSTGILKSRKETNKIVFTVNWENSIIESLRELIVKSSGFGAKFSKIAKEVGKVEAIVMTQAYLENEYNDPNDIDFLFVGDIDTRKLAIGMKEIENDQGRELKYAALTMQDFDFGKKKRTPVLVNLLSKDFVVINGSMKRLVI